MAALGTLDGGEWIASSTAFFGPVALPREYALTQVREKAHFQVPVESYPAGTK
jgi:hypothetical protein